MVGQQPERPKFKAKVKVQGSKTDPRGKKPERPKFKARVKVQGSKTDPRGKKQRPPPVVRCDLAVYDKHWKMMPNLPGCKTDGNGYGFLIQDVMKCTVFTKFSSLVKHMKDIHYLTVEKPPRGRPKSGGGSQNPLTEEQLLSQNDRMLGSFPMRWWVAKKRQMLKALKWAHSMWVASRPKGDKWQFVLGKAEGARKSWKHGVDHTRAKTTISKSVQAYWDCLKPPLDEDEARQMASYPKSIRGIMHCTSDDGMPEVDTSRSVLEDQKYYFKPRMINKLCPGQMRDPHLLYRCPVDQEYGEESGVNSTKDREEDVSEQVNEPKPN